MKSVAYRRAIWIAAILGLTLGIGGTVWFLMPPGPLELRFVHSAPVAQTYRDRDGHSIRIYVISGDVDQVSRAAEAELRPAQGWQPPTLRSKDPLVVQITRVKSPRGDFQFDRVVIEADDAPGKVRVTLDEGPIQRDAFQ